MNTQLRFASAITVVAATVALSAPSFAAAPVEAQPGASAQVVHFADLDLSTPTGVRTLYGRIRTAAWQVCSIIAPTYGPSTIDNLKCRRTLVDDAVARVNQPALTALHTGKTWRRLVARR